MGNVQTITDHNFGQDQLHSFVYDDYDRLTQASTSSNPAYGYFESYAYNHVGGATS